MASEQGNRQLLCTLTVTELPDSAFAETLLEPDTTAPSPFATHPRERGWNTRAHSVTEAGLSRARAPWHARLPRTSAPEASLWGETRKAEEAGE